MRIAVFLMLVPILQTFASQAYSQKAKISVDFSKTRLVDALDKIEELSEFYFLFNEKLVDTNREVSLSAENKKISEILDNLFEGTDVVYTIADRKIILAPGFLSNTQQQTKTVSGRVTDISGEALPGVTVVIKGTMKGTITDMDGNFILSGVSAENSLVFSFIGMKTQEKEIAGQSVISVVLKEDMESLEEVIVTGYGNFKKASFTGSASTVGSAKMKDIPVVNIAQKLQGQAAGVFIGATSGQPGAVGQIRIRGMGSFSATNEPLYIIDGIPVNSGSMINASGYMTQSKTDIMSTINPNDIENITIIKDAAAASLYGSRAANGIILITTKRGKAGQTKVDLTISGGISNLAMDNRPMVTGEQRRELVYESLYNQAVDNGESDPTAYADGFIESYAPEPWSGYTNWEDYLLRKNAYSQDYSASVSGGDERSKFLASVGWMNTEGMAINSDFERYSGNLSYDRKISEKMNFKGKMVLSKITQNLNEERGTLAGPYFLLGSYITPSDYPYNEDGSYNYTNNINTSAHYNVVETMNTDINRATITRMMTSGSIDYEIFDGLKVKESLNYDFTNQKDIVYYCPNSGAGPKGAATGTAEAWKSFAEQNRIYSSTSLGYVKTFNGKHNVDVLAAYEVEKFNSDYLLAKGNTIASDELTDVGVTSVTNSVTSGPSEYRLASYVSRLNYDYDGKYYFGASFRRDGTSRLSESQRWGNFWSVSGMWRLIDEPFLEGIKSTFTDLKLRTSYGVNGNLPSSNYAYRGLYNYSLAYMGNSGSYEKTLQNDDLKWEKNYNLNVGLDFTLFDRVSVTSEYYSRQTKDLIYSMPLSYSSGFGSKLTNIGHISNKGFEISFNTTNIRRGDFTWTTDLSFAHNENTIKKINDQVDFTTASNRVTMYIRKVGGPFYEFYLKEYAGVDPANGDALFYVNTTDEDGNIIDHTTTTNNPSEANVVDVGKHAMPNLTSNMTNTFYYKNFDLSFTFTGAWGGYSFDYAAHYSDVDGSNVKRNYRDYTMDRWQKPGDITDVPRLSLANSAVPTNNTRFLHSNDYIRLKSLSFGYTLPEKITKKAKMGLVRFYLSGSNLFTYAAYDKYDPETEMGGFSWASAPTTKNITIGANISF